MSATIHHLSDYRKPQHTNAWRLYNEASAIDGDPKKRDAAKALYHRAITLYPLMDVAYTNLGNLYFNDGHSDEARNLYLKALGLNPEQCEALYNLGYLEMEDGNPIDAIPLLRRALAVDPSFADAHFNIAMAYEQCDEAEKGQPHWREYIRLEERRGNSTWLEIARRHLNDQTTSNSKV